MDLDCFRLGDIIFSVIWVWGICGAYSEHGWYANLALFSGCQGKAEVNL